VVAPQRAYLLLWAVGLSMFGVASFAEAFSAVAWNGPVFRSWYLFGAMLNAAWIGQGTIYLLVRPRVAHVVTIVVVLLSLVGAYGLIALNLNADAFSADLSLAEQYKEIMPKGAWVRAMTPLFNIYGLIAIVGGAVYSSWLFWRERSHPNRMWSNVLIAVGALVIAFAGTLTRLGIGDFLYVGELAAATLMFAGFRLASQWAPQPARAVQLSSVQANPR
jgi:hypothetical protein